MKIGAFVALVAISVATIGAYGAEITGATAESTASVFLQRSSMARRMLPDRSVSSSRRWGGLWIVNLSPSGHIVLSASDKCAPIQQFSSDDFTEPEEGSARLDLLSATSARCAEAETDPEREVNSEWASYATYSSATRRSKAGAANADDCSPFVAPFLNASWHQGSPYGDFSPLTVVCGCMATAAGQELRYWRWPYHMPKFRTWRHGVANEPAQDIRVNGFVPFDYDLIYGSYAGGGTPEKTGLDSRGNNAKRARFEAAWLTQWAQSLVHMHFAPGASGGTQKLCQEANEFAYERGSVISKWSEGYDGLWAAITNDLEFGSPIQVNTPGHQMVIDGYGVEIDDGVQKDWININYGWGGGITWVDLRTECESRSLAHFQVGYRPRKMVQIEPIAKKISGSVDLTFHLPFCYTNSVSHFDIYKYTVSDEGDETLAAVDTVPCGASNTATVFTRTVSANAPTGQKLRFYAIPVMIDGSDAVLSDPVDTSVGTPAPYPAIKNVSVRANGIELLQDGFFAECGIGVTNEIKVTCSESTTELMGYTSRPTMLPDEKVSVEKDGNVFTIRLDATEVLGDWDGDMMRFTLVARNEDGTAAYKDMVLRFSSVRKVVNGTYQVVESGTMTEPLDFCGTGCILDANGNTLSIAAGTFTGKGSVILENTVATGGFAFESLNDFSGTLSLIDGVAVTPPENTDGYHGTLRTISGSVPILGNLPETAGLYVEAGATNILSGVDVRARLTGAGTVCVTSGVNRLGDASGFSGSIVVSGAGTVLKVNAGDEGYVVIESGSSLWLELTDEQYNFGYSTGAGYIVSDGGSVVFMHNGESCATVFADGVYAFEPTANTWTWTGENDRYTSVDHWSKNRLPVNDEYVIFRLPDDDFVYEGSILLDMASDVALKAIKVTGPHLFSRFEILDNGGHTLSAEKLVNDITIDLNTSHVLVQNFEPASTVWLHAGKPVAYTINGIDAAKFRSAADPNGQSGLVDPEAWHGTVVFEDWNSNSGTGGTVLNPNAYGNAMSFVRFAGVTGWLYYNESQGGATYIPTVELVDDGDAPALVWNSGSGAMAEVFEKLTGYGTFRTRNPSSGGWEKVLVKDVSEFYGDFDLEAKTVALGGTLIPSTDTSNNGRLHICSDVTNQASSVWRANDNVFIAPGAKLSVKGVIDTQTIVSFGADATIDLLDGGEIRVLSGSASSEPATFAQNFRAGMFKLKDNITQDLAINFCAAPGTWTTVDADGKTLTFGPAAMTGSGDVYFTSSDVVNRGKVVIQGLNHYSGTIHVDGTVDIEFPENITSSSCAVLVMPGASFSVKAGNERNVRVQDGATLSVILSADQVLYGYDASSTVTLEEGGKVEFFNRKGERILSASADATVYEPLPGVTTGLSATAVWMTGGFEHPTNDFEIALNGNAIANRNILITDSSTQGVTIDLPYGEFLKASVLVRFRIPEGGAPASNSALAGVLSTDWHPISAICRTQGGTGLEGAYLDFNNGYAVNAGQWNFTASGASAPSADAGHGYMLFAYQSDAYGGATHGAAIYLGNSLENLYGGSKPALQWGGKTLNTISIGGPVDTQEKTFPWAGLEIDGIALFADQWLTPEEVQDFAFPHAVLDILDGETLRVEAGNPRTYDSVGSLAATGTIKIDNITDLAEGTYLVARWRGERSGYGKVGTLDVAGLDEDYAAELVYGTKDISLRVFKAVYRATLSGDATFSADLFTPALQSNCLRKTLEVSATANATLALPAGGIAVKAIDFVVADGATLSLTGGPVSADVIGIYSANPINGTLDLGEGTVVKLPADVESPFQLAATVNGTISSLILGDSVFNGEWTLDGNTLTIKRYRAISINFGADQSKDGVNAAVGTRVWEGIASVANWLDTVNYGVNNTYPTMGQSSLVLSDSEGTRYSSMKLCINSRGGNWKGHGDTSTTTAALLYGFIDDFSGSTVNAGVKVTGVNEFAAKYSVYVYFNADVDAGTTNMFPPYYINDVMYMGDGANTVPGRQTWGTVLSDSLVEGVNSLVVHGLTNDTLVVVQPHNMGGRGCIAAIQIVEDKEHEFEVPDCMVPVTVVPPSGEWSSLALPTYAYPTNVAGSFVSFGSTTPTDYYQMLGGRETIVALITGTDSVVYEAAGLQTETETKSCGDRDLYLLISGGTFDNAIGIINQDWSNNGNKRNGLQSGGNAMVQIGGDAVVGYAYGAGREGNGGTAPGSTGVTIKDAAVLTGSAFGGWSSYHNLSPAVDGSTSVKVLNVQSVNEAAALPDGIPIPNDAIVGGSVYAANTDSGSVIAGSSSVVVDLSEQSISQQTNFVKRLVGGSAGFGGASNKGGIFSTAGDSSVTVTAPDNVIFTGDITGGGFIENNTRMYATVGGDSSVTLNGGTYSGITITAGARGTDRATVAGDATLTINGGVFTGATLDAGNAAGEKTLVLGPGASVADAAEVTGFATFRLPAETSFPFALAASVTVPDGATPRLFIGDEEYTLAWTLEDGVIELEGMSRTAVVAGSDSVLTWSELPWDVDLPVLGNATNTVIVTGCVTIDMESVSTAKIVFDVAEGVELALEGTAVASQIQVTGLGSVACKATGTLQGTISGDGTVVYDGVEPPTDCGWTDEAWSGTVWLMNATSNGPWYASKLCNSGSKLKLTNVKGYLPGMNYYGAWMLGYDGSSLGELVLEDDSDGNAAYNRTDGYSHNASRNSYCMFSRLSGTGTFTDSKDQFVYVVSNDASEFAGSLCLTNHTTVVIGDASPAETTYNGMIVLEAGKTAQIANGKTWRATDAGLLVKGGMFFVGSGSFEGDVRSEGGATLDFSGSASAQPVTGTLTIENGATIRLPGDATFPYRLADEIAIDDPCSVTLQIGDEVYSGTSLKVADGAILRDRTAVFPGSESAVGWDALGWDIGYGDLVASNTVHATGSGTINLGGISASKLYFDVDEGVELTLTGTASATEIYVTGLGSVVCSAENTLVGTLKGDGTVAYSVNPAVGQGRLVITDTARTGTLTIDGESYKKAISINFGDSYGVIGDGEWAGIVPVVNWLNTSESGAATNYPTGAVSLSITDSRGTSYPDMQLYLCSRGGNWFGKGDRSTPTASLLHGFLDNSNSSPNNNSGVKLTGMNSFATKYAVYVYFSKDADAGSTSAFPFYYINGIGYCGDGTATVPGSKVWGTVLKDELVDGVNALVVRGLTDDTLVIAQPNNAGGRGCIAGIQIVEDPDGEMPVAFGEVSILPPSADWSSRELPTLAYTTNVAGSFASFGASPAYQLIGNRLAIVANVTGTEESVYEIAGLQSELDDSPRYGGDCDIYLLINGGTVENAIGIINQNYGGVANGSQSGGNAMVQIGGDAVVGYAYGAGREGNGGAAPGSTGVTIKDAAVLTGSAFGGWSSYHAASPTVAGSTSVKVLNVQSVNSASSELAILPGSIVGGSVYGTNVKSGTVIYGSSSVDVEIADALEQTNFVKRLVGGCAGFALASWGGGTFSVRGDSSVTVSAPENVVFTGDITGGGFIENNDVMYTEVDGNSSVTLNGGTYSGITITAGARGTERATVAGDATLTINGGVFEGVALEGGNATGEKTLALNGTIDLADATIAGFDSCVVGADSIVTMCAGQEGAITVPAGSTLRLVASHDQSATGYEPTGITCDGAVEYWEYVGSVLTKVPDSRVSGVNLLAKEEEEPSIAPEVGYMDGTAVVITNFAATVTIPVSATDVRMVYGGSDVTGAFLAPVKGEPCTLELNPAGSVGGVMVRPEIDMAAPVPYDASAADEVTVAVKVIGGLWYRIAYGNGLEGGVIGGEGVGVTESVQASETGTLLLSAPKGAGRRFFRIQAMPASTP